MVLFQSEPSGRPNPKLFCTSGRDSASFLPFLVWMDQARVGHTLGWDLSNHNVNAWTKAVAKVCPTKVLDKRVCFKSIPESASRFAATQSQPDTVRLAEDISWNIITLRYLLSFLACMYCPLWRTRHQNKTTLFYKCKSKELLLLSLFCTCSQSTTGSLCAGLQAKFTQRYISYQINAVLVIFTSTLYNNCARYLSHNSLHFGYQIAFHSLGSIIKSEILWCGV